MSATRNIEHSSGTITLTTQSSESQEPSGSQNSVATVRLRSQDKKKVNWKNDTVDNENMNKKSSKCCCIYEKPHAYDESSSDSEDGDCDHCRGHVEKKPAKKACDQNCC